MGILIGSLFVAQNGRCFHCDKPMSPRAERDSGKGGWTKEHVVPKSICIKKRWRLKYNIVLAHGRCNRKKGNKFPTQEEVIKLRDVYKKVLNF